MPEPKLIQVPPDELVELFTELGVVTPPGQWWLSDIVLPISIVDSRISLNATATPIVPAIYASAGELAGPVAGTVLADSGQLAAGDWYFLATWSGDSSNVAFRIEHRNAANSANIKGERFYSLGNQAGFDHERVYTVALNERIRIIAATNTGGTVQGSLFLKQL